MHLELKTEYIQVGNAVIRSSLLNKRNSEPEMPMNISSHGKPKMGIKLSITPRSGKTLFENDFDHE